ncbi:uncharacterized protein IWZ02DRAFT_422916 [Phyllosticta citriasiana]|uniref:uncharacterized protein n=1 Tax=Phyllosticta citriasiana TaxID=595635 RepID=UPI0030FD81F1
MAADKVFRVGVDVGGTNTDCVIIHPGESDAEHRGIRSTFKFPTTPDVTSGIVNAIEGALSKCDVKRDSICAVIIGTTHFVNAVVQADDRNLRKVAVLRVCGPYTQENPSFLDFPPILARIMNGHTAYLDGGLEYDGREILPINEEQVRKECEVVKEKGIDDIAVIGVFSPLDTEGTQEARVRQIVLEELPHAHVVLSRDIGQLGYLERENATILNTSILKYARRTIRGFKLAMTSLGLSCALFLTQNDGTVIDADTVEGCPIKTFSSGPTNSMAGAAYLANIENRREKFPNSQVIVADVGGTSTDACALLPSGFPRQAGTWVEVGGVRCSFSMPEVVSIALGGGTKVEEKDGKVLVGPESVGYNLLTEGLVFGGRTLTVTDVAVASGKAEVGDKEKVNNVDNRIVIEARLRIKKLLEKVVESMKLTADDALVILVGGGSIAHLDNLDGVSHVIRPPYYDCANAVGAAIAKVAGQVDAVKVLEGKDEDAVLAEVCKEAAQRAIDAGADPSTVEIVSVDNMPIQYTSMKASRIIVKAAGSLGKQALLKPTIISNLEEAPAKTVAAVTNGIKNSEKNPRDFEVSPSAAVDIRSYRPEVDANGTWWVSEVDCEFLATGCSVLACGGGGPGYMCYLAARAALKAGHRLPVVDVNTLPDDGAVLGSVSYGAPIVTLERLPSGTEAADATEALMSSFPGMKMAAQIAIEIGGMNGIRPMLNAIPYNVPTIDGDLMARAYPRLYIMTPYVFGKSITPCTQADGQGNTVTVNKCADTRRVEKIHRKAALEIGLFSEMVPAPLTVREVKEVGTLKTTSLAWNIGRAVFMARREKRDIMKAIIEANPSGKILYVGKIISVRRFVSSGGYTEGSVRLKPLSEEEKEYGDTEADPVETRELFLPFQNEYLYASLIRPEQTGARDVEMTGEVVCTVPDLISLIGSDGYALGTQDLRYGVKVCVISFAAHPHWKTPQGLKLGGLHEFGYTDLEYVPYSKPYYDPMTVMEEFRP